MQCTNGSHGCRQPIPGEEKASPTGADPKDPLPKSCSQSFLLQTLSPTWLAICFFADCEAHSVTVNDVLFCCGSSFDYPHDVVADDAGIRNVDRFRERMNSNGRCFHVGAVFRDI